ncbi:hypothetical protein RCL1_004948 [Eukaryota sp. TZLM3-RCL]
MYTKTPRRLIGDFLEQTPSPEASRPCTRQIRRVRDDITHHQTLMFHQIMDLRVKVDSLKEGTSVSKLQVSVAVIALAYLCAFFMS